MAGQGQPAPSEAVVARARELLERDITAVEAMVPDGRRHRVLRIRFDGGSAVVKDAGPVELAAYRRLEKTGVTPRVLAGAPGVVVLEDLAGERLDRLLTKDRSGARAAAALVEMAEALGTIHRATRADGRSQAGNALESFRMVCRRLGIAVDLGDITPGPALALTQGDVGPDNCIVTPDGLRLIDFELAAWDDPLRDAAHWRMGFPCCGCAGRIPGELLDEMDRAHRRAWGDPVGFGAPERSLALLVCDRVSRLVEWEVLERDYRWGSATLRQRMLSLLAGFDHPDVLPDFTAVVRRLEQCLRTRWPGVADSLPGFPALS